MLSKNFLSLLFISICLPASLFAQDNVNHEAEEAFERGVKFLDEGDYDNAYENLNIATEKDADNPEYFYYFAMENYLKDDAEFKALEYPDLFPELNPKNSANVKDLWHLKGLSQMRMGNYEQAALSIINALDITLIRDGIDSIETAYFYRQIGSTYLLKGDYSTAYNYSLDALERVLESLPHDDPIAADYWMDVGKTLHWLEEYELADNYYDKALRSYHNRYQSSDPAMIEIWDAIANNLVELGQPEEGLEILETLLANMTDNGTEGGADAAIIMGNMANILAQAGRFDEAIYFYERCLVFRIANFGPAHPLTREIQQKLSLIEDIRETGN